MKVYVCVMYVGVCVWVVCVSESSPDNTSLLRANSHRKSGEGQRSAATRSVEKARGFARLLEKSRDFARVPATAREVAGIRAPSRVRSRLYMRLLPRNRRARGAGARGGILPAAARDCSSILETSSDFSRSRTAPFMEFAGIPAAPRASARLVRFLKR